MLGHVFINVFKHGRHAGHVAANQSAMALGQFLRGNHFGLDFLMRRFVLLLGPRADFYQMLLEPRNGIAQREMRPVVGGTIFGWIVGRGMWAGDRKSVVWGKGVAVRVDSGGGRLRKKKRSI